VSSDEMFWNRLYTRLVAIRESATVAFLIARYDSMTVSISETICP
jgi:hypothetical protein